MTDDAPRVMRVRSTLFDGAEVWVVADAEALAAHPEVTASGLPWFYSAEVTRLKGKTPEALRAILAAKRVFPGCEILK